MVRPLYPQVPIATVCTVLVSATFRGTPPECLRSSEFSTDKPAQIRNRSAKDPLSCVSDPWSASMRQAVWVELREVAWLVSVIAGLSVVGVGLAVAIAAA